MKIDISQITPYLRLHTLLTMETHIDEEDQKYKTGSKRGKAQRKPKSDAKSEASTALTLPSKKGIKKKA
jgi:hypothetical protein